VVKEFNIDGFCRLPKLTRHVKIGSAWGGVAAYTKFKTFVYEARLLRPECCVISRKKTFVYGGGGVRSAAVAGGGILRGDRRLLG
jgi:hypothetical protein